MDTNLIKAKFTSMGARLKFDTLRPRRWSWMRPAESLPFQVDHKTAVLSSWHRVLLNTETQTRAMGSVAFLD